MKETSQPKILVINPGSTSTKVAVFEGERNLVQKILRHGRDQIGKCHSVWDQFDFRRAAIAEFLKENDIPPSSFSAVVGRGGLFRSIPGGTYLVNERMLEDARGNLQGEHVSNLGCALAQSFAEEACGEAFVVDPVSVDEFEPLARYSGHPLIERRALAHALNLHEAARRAAAQIGKAYSESSFVVAHLGGGISIAPVKEGKIIDVNDASSDGPFSPERTGGLPLQPFIGLCFSGKYREAEVRKIVMGEGGLHAYLGTHLAHEVETRIEEGDANAKEVYEAMAYQIAKEIAEMAAVLCGEVDGIVLTGGLANSTMLTRWISNRVAFISPVIIFPGEFEMEAMANGALRVLQGVEEPKEY